VDHGQAIRWSGGQRNGVELRKLVERVQALSTALDGLAIPSGFDEQVPQVQQRLDGAERIDLEGAQVVVTSLRETGNMRLEARDANCRRFYSLREPQAKL